MNKTKPNLARAAMTLLFAVLSSFMAVSTCFAATGSPTKGSCGPSDKPEAVLWEFNMATQTLTISGEGDMADFTVPTDAPWYNWLNDITSVVVADGVTSVSDYAFSSDYWQLSSVTMASTVLSIGDYAFCNVPLTSIQQIKTENAARKKEEAVDEPVASFLPDNLQTIGQYAFCNTKITSLTIPAYVNSIGEGSLSYNSYLTTLTCLGTMIVPWLDGDVLEGSPVTAIYVPDAAIDDYKNAECWQQYASLLKPISEQVDEPGDEPGGDDVELVNGSELLTIGTHDRSDSSLPCDQYSKYSMSQQIYTKEEIGKKGLITSIAFYGYDFGMERTCDVYLTPTTKNSFESRTDWVTVAPGDKVFSGLITVNSGQWTIIDFDTPYEYDGKTNLLVTVDDNSNSENSSTVYWGVFNTSESQAMYYSKWWGNPANLDPTQPIEEQGSYTNRKNCIQFCFETYPKPYQVDAVEVGNVSAQIQCSLRGNAKAWNLRYRKVAGEGEEESRWTVFDESFNTRSFTLEELTPATKYEVQVQAVFAAEDEGGEDNLSVWTNSLVFTTNCCPVEEQAELIYALKSNNYVGWYGFAVQIVDITDADNPVEAAYLSAPSYQMYGGTVTLCCGHKYKVNWIYDADYAVYNKGKSFALYLEPGDLLYSMDYGEAPEETAELTTFIMDCTPYCTQMPQNLVVDGTTYNSATISFRSETKAGEVVYSTEADFDPEASTPTSMDFTALTVDPNGWDPNPANASLTLTGLEPLTAYYVRVRSICTAEPIGKSRWSKPVKVTTGSRYDGPSNLIAEPINSRTEKLTWQNGGTSSMSNIYYRVKVDGTPVNTDDIQTIGGGNGSGFEEGWFGEGTWGSGGNRPYSNILYVGNVPGSNTYSFLAGQGKSGMSAEKFLYGMVEQTEATPLEQMRKLDRECLNDADREARIRNIKSLIGEINKELYELGNRLNNGEITQDEYDKKKAELEKELSEKQSELETLESLPTDDEKLDRMKELEGELESVDRLMDDLLERLQKDEIGVEQYDAEMKTLKEDYYKNEKELRNLRATTSAAENINKDGFSITYEVPSGVDTEPNAPKSRALKRAEEDAKYVFFIRHSNGNGSLVIKDLTITPNELLNEWTVIPNVSGSSYMLTGLDPETTYEVMVEAVYDSGIAGSRSPIATFTTIGAETDPSEGVFSVAENKKVQFAKGNLRYQGDEMEGHWSMAKQQYEVLGQENVESQRESTYPAYFKDLLCWSTAKSRGGVYSYYYSDDEDAEAYFKGDFADWGENAAVISDLGSGWSTLSKDEWNYLLNERPNAVQLKSVATVAGVKGLVLIPDEWTAPDGVLVSEEMTAEQWAAVEQTGVVFLPVAGQMTVTYDNSSWNTTTTLTEVGTYWTSTPSGDKSDVNAIALTIGDADVTLDTDLYRRVYTAVRLVKKVVSFGDVDGDGYVTADDVVLLINVLAGKITDTEALLAADLNNDGVVNIADIIILTNLIGSDNE